MQTTLDIGEGLKHQYQAPYWYIGAVLYQNSTMSTLGEVFHPNKKRSFGCCIFFFISLTFIFILNEFLVNIFPCFKNDGMYNVSTSIDTHGFFNT